jgi:hypothetical protein
MRTSNHKTIRLHRDEYDELLQARKDALSDAWSRWTFLDHVPVAWRGGSKAVIEVLGRAYDGDIRARVVCSLRGQPRRYVRNLRIPYRPFRRPSDAVTLRRVG